MHRSATPKTPANAKTPLPEPKYPYTHESMNRSTTNPSLRIRGGMSLLLMTAIALCFSACGGKAPIFIGEAEPEDFSLSYQVPQEYTFEITEEGAGKHSFDLELTYFSEQMQGWDAIPLYYIHVAPGNEEKDKRFQVSVKAEDGNWRGELLENENDRKFQQTIESGLQLNAGKHTLKLYGDSREEGKPILGIVKATLKVFKD